MILSLNLSNFRLTLWQIEGNFDAGFILNVTKNTVYLGQTSMDDETGPVKRKMLRLKHKVEAHVLGESNPGSRFFRIEFNGIYDLSHDSTIGEVEYKMCGEIGFARLQEIVNAVLSKSDGLRLNLVS